jgi:hypothetical protein
MLRVAHAVAYFAPAYLRWTYAQLQRCQAQQQAA